MAERCRIIQCKSGEIYGTKPVIATVDLDRCYMFEIDCPEKGCVATIYVDFLMSRRRVPRCSNSNCYWNTAYSE
jgi:hypothetical protein